MIDDLGGSKERRTDETSPSTDQGKVDGFTLREIRRLMSMTRGQVAKAAGMTRYRVAKIEDAEDMAVSALHAYVKALGGRLELAVEFPDRPTVTLQTKRRRLVASIKLHDPALQRGDGS